MVSLGVHGLSNANQQGEEMRTRIIMEFLLVLIVCTVPVWSQSKAQPKDKTGGGGDNSAASASSAISVQPQQGACPTHSKTLEFGIQSVGSSATQPYIAIPLVQNGHVPTLYAGEDLYISVSATADQAKELPLLTIGIDTAKADTINPDPLRPTISAAAAALAYNRFYCVQWPRQLIGDTTPKITITGLYVPGGTPNADKEKTINLVTTTYPQVHNLYRYNIATGVIASSLRNPSFNRVQSAPASGSTPAQYTTLKDNGDISAAPVLMFSAYLIKPMDAESHWRRDNLIPAASVGFSLSSPGDNFFFGGSSEIRRNVQLVYGYHLGKVNELSKTLVNDPTSSAAPTTTKRFHGGVFGGLTFNIDFIKGLFSGK
jgi:hypothetical protein